MASLVGRVTSALLQRSPFRALSGLCPSAVNVVTPQPASVRRTSSVSFFWARGTAHPTYGHLAYEQQYFRHKMLHNVSEISWPRRVTLHFPVLPPAVPP